MRLNFYTSALFLLFLASNFKLFAQCTEPISASVTQIQCSNMGTSNPNDDKISFVVTVSGGSTGGTWASNGLGGGALGVPQTYTKYLKISDGIQSFSITSNTGCTATLVINPGVSCSPNCVWDNSNGSGSGTVTITRDARGTCDPSDDMVSGVLTLHDIPDGETVGVKIKTGQGTPIAVGDFGYVGSTQSIPFGPYLITDIKNPGTNGFVIWFMVNSVYDCLGDIWVSIPPVPGCPSEIKPNAGTDRKVDLCNMLSPEINLGVAPAGTVWSILSMPPNIDAPISFDDRNGILRGIYRDVQGVYVFVLSNELNPCCSDTVYISTTPCNTNACAELGFPHSYNNTEVVLPCVANSQYDVTYPVYIDLPSIFHVSLTDVYVYGIVSVPSGSPSNLNFSSTGLFELGKIPVGHYTFTITSRTNPSCFDVVNVVINPCDCVTFPLGDDETLSCNNSTDPITSYQILPAPAGVTYSITSTTDLSTSFAINSSTGLITGISGGNVYKIISTTGEGSCIDEKLITVPVCACPFDAEAYVGQDETFYASTPLDNPLDYQLPAAPSGYNWIIISQPSTASAYIDVNVNVLASMTQYGYYIVKLQSLANELCSAELVIAKLPEGGNPLPVNCLNFDGIIQRAGIELVWSVANESNNKMFEVMRSTNGVNFESIKTVSAKNTSNVVNRYSIVDNKGLLAGKSYYYKLIQVDNDGSKNAICNTVSLKFNANGGTYINGINPNPNSGSFVLSLMSEAKENNSVVSIYDAQGRTVFSKNVDFTVGLNSLEIELSGLASGLYYLNVRTDKLTLSDKFTKL